MNKILSKILLPASALLAGTISLSGQVFLSGDIDAGTGELTISSDLNFTANLAGDVQALVFKGWGTPPDTAIDGGQLLSALSYSIDGGAVQTVSGGAVLYDNYVDSYGDVEPSDAFIFFDSAIPITAGQTISFFSDTWALTATGGSPMGPGDGWNSVVTGAYGGDVFLMSDDAVSLSNTIQVAVPEPSMIGILMGSLILGLLVNRRCRG